jgi:tetratricopeptide (TPR) repeat protein
MKIKQSLVVCSGLLLLGFADRAAGQATDQVYGMRGSPTSGIISDAETTPAEVVIEVKGSPQRIAVNEIKRINFMGEPSELKRARDSILLGQLESGYAELKKIDPNSIKRPVVQADLQYYLAYAQGKLALTGGGDKAAAAKAMLAFVSSNKKSFHFYEAAELLGDLAVSLESYDGATRYYGALAQAPWPDYKMRGSVLEARALLQKGDAVAALGKYESVIAANLDTPAALQQKLFAQVGKAVCLGGTGQHGEGITMIEDMVMKNSPEGNSELFGRAYNALGACYLKAGKPKDALMAYLHTDVLFYSNADVHAEALYHLGKLWSAANKQNRAVDAQNLLTSRYAGSVWAKRE